MPKLSLWKNRKSKDYQFLDRLVYEQFVVGGVEIYIRKYKSPIEEGVDEDELNELSIQDLIFGENRDRKYEPNYYKLLGHYLIADQDLELLQFGLQLADGTIFVTFPLNVMVDSIGRKIMAGDVLEFPNLREDLWLDEDRAAANRMYVVLDATYPAEGYSHTWFPHLWRVRAKPITDSREFQDIFENGETTTGSGTGRLGQDADNQADDLTNAISSYQEFLEMNEAVYDQTVHDRNLDTLHLYIEEDDERGTQYAWVFAGDGQPQNKIPLSGSGDRFPENPSEDDYFLRTDYEPQRLFKYNNTCWVKIEDYFNTVWSPAHRIIKSHINNENETNINGEVVVERQPISKAIKPGVDK